MTTNFQAVVNNCTSAPGLTYGSSDATKAKIANTTFFKVNGRSMYVAGAEVSLVGAVRTLPSLNGSAQTAGVLAFDDGTVPVTTNSCRIYAIVATSAQTEAGTVTLSAIAGEDFPKHRQAQASDFPVPADPNSVVLGWIYLKAEATAFTPGTTNLHSVSGLTNTYTDNYAQSGL